VKYAFIVQHRAFFCVRSMCRVLKVHRSGFYAWLKEPLSRKAKDDRRLASMLRQAWLESGCVYGYRNFMMICAPLARSAV